MMIFTVLFCLSSFLIIYCYALYPILLKLLPTPEQSFAGEFAQVPSISVIVSAFNEEKYIREKLENLLSLDSTGGEVEFLIGSDGSSDNTDEIIKEYVDKGIKYFRVEDRKGKLNVVHRLITEEAKGEILVFSDANTVFKKDALIKLLQPFVNESIGSVCGELHFTGGDGNEVENLEGAYWRLEQYLKFQEGKRGCLLGANGAIFAIRRKVYKSVPENTVVEDFVIPMRIVASGYQAVYQKEAMAFEETSKKIEHEKGRRVRIGAGNYQALFMTLDLLNPANGFVAFAYFSHKVLRWLTPFLMIVALFCNAFLLASSWYQITFVFQLFFYALALIGFVLENRGPLPKIIGLPYYFVAMNAALLLGFIKFVKQSQQVTWERTER